MGEQTREVAVFDQTDPKWQQLVAEITSGIKDWMDQNPKATMADIERETMRRMAQLQARLMEDILRAKAAEQKADERERVLCAECGAEMEYRGDRERSLQAQGGQEVVFQRGYTVCPKCGAGFFPPG
jgi:RNA polymerase-binding transcription factor DksA